MTATAKRSTLGSGPFDGIVEFEMPDGTTVCVEHLSPDDEAFSDSPGTFKAGWFVREGLDPNTMNDEPFASEADAIAFVRTTEAEDYWAAEEDDDTAGNDPAASALIRD